MTINNKEYTQWKKTSIRKKIIFGTCLAVAGIGVGTGIGIAFSPKKNELYVKTFNGYDDLTGYWNGYVGTTESKTFDGESASWDYADWINTVMDCEFLMRMISYNISVIQDSDVIPITAIIRGLEKATIVISEQKNLLHTQLGNIYNVYMIANGEWIGPQDKMIKWELEFTTAGPMRAHYAHGGVPNEVGKPTNEYDWFDIAQPGFKGNEDPDNVIGNVFGNAPAIYIEDENVPITAQNLDLQIPKSFVPNVKYTDSSSDSISFSK